MALKTKALLCALALLASAHAAQAQQTPPPPIWTGEGGSAPVQGADQEHSGERAIGDVVAENAWSYRRTARLASAYEADIQGARVALPAGTPLAARFSGAMIRVAGEETQRLPEAARGTVVWCALPERGRAPCFFWDTEGGVYAQALMTGGAPSERGWLGTATPAPSPDIAEQDAGLPRRETRILIQEANAQGYILQVVTQEAGMTYTRSYPRRPWNEWQYMFLAPHQRMKATPVVDASGAVRGANVEFTRVPPSPG